jgi:hypothetical protein
MARRLCDAVGFATNGLEKKAKEFQLLVRWSARGMRVAEAL